MKPAQHSSENRASAPSRTCSASTRAFAKPVLALVAIGILSGLVMSQWGLDRPGADLTALDVQTGEGVVGPKQTTASLPTVTSDAVNQDRGFDSTQATDSDLQPSASPYAASGGEGVEPGSASPGLTPPEASSAGQVAVQELLDLSQQPVTPTQAGEWRNALQQLVGSGDGAVQPIAEYLSRHEDLALDQIDPSGLMGYDSLRLALFDALADIGTPAAQGALSQVLGVTADPREIEWIAAHLEELAPSQHREETLAAARDALALAANGELAGRDVGPLFAVLGHYGDAEAVADVESVAHLWGYYGLMATAKLPEAVRVEPLAQTASRSNGASQIRSEFALRLLAEEAWDSAASYQSLTEIARTQELSSRAWEGIAEGLGGIQARIESSKLDEGGNLSATSDLRRYHIAAGNQNFLTAAKGGMTIEEIRSRTAIIDGLLALQPGSTAEKALQSQLERLNAMDPYMALAAGL